MIPLDDHRRLFEFDAWANRTVASALRQLPSPPPDAVRLLAHIAAVSMLWRSRLRGEVSPLPVWPDLDLTAVEQALDAAGAAWRAELERLDAADLMREIGYVNSAGESWRSAVGDLLAQTVLHGVHHRGQILALLRAAGVAPPALDYIHAVRTGALACRR